MNKNLTPRPEMDHSMPNMPDMDDMCSMSMTFNWNSNVCVVFESWHVRSKTQLIFTCFAIFAIAYFHQYFLFLSTQARSHGMSRHARARNALWYGLNTCFSVFLMLVYMTYNGYLLIAVVFGAMAGHFHYDQQDQQSISLCH